MLSCKRRVKCRGSVLPLEPLVYLVCKWLVRQDVLTVSYALGIVFCIRNALCIWPLLCGSSECGCYPAIELDPQTARLVVEFLFSLDKSATTELHPWPFALQDRSCYSPQAGLLPGPGMTDMLRHAQLRAPFDLK